MTAPTTLWLRRLVSPGRPQAPDRGGVRPLLDHVRLRNVSVAGVSQRSQARRIGAPTVCWQRDRSGADRPTLGAQVYMWRGDLLPGK